MTAPMATPAKSANEGALFPADFLRQIERLHLVARQIAKGRMRAERRSVKRGAGLEFADYRPFSPGDDIRSIDWNAYARSRHLLLKLFEEEEDLHVHLLLDATASMAWGEPAKFDQARRLAAGLAYLALSNFDRAGITPLGAPPGTPSWSPSRGRARFLRLLRFLEGCRVGKGPCVMESSIRSWLATKPRRGLVLWITDTWGASGEDFFQALDRLRYARHEIGVLQVRHAEEAAAGEPGEFDLVEVESGALKPMIVDQRMAAAYREKVLNYEARIKETCRRHGLAHLQMDAAESAVAVLERALHAGGFVR